MNPRLPSTRRHATIVIILALFAWLGIFVREMFPFGLPGDSFLYDAIAWQIIFWGIIVFLLWVAVLLALSVWTPSPRRRFALVMAAVGVGMVPLFWANPGALGRRFGASLGICLQPVCDLQQSPAIAKIAAAGEQANLPQSDWPASLSEWRTTIRMIEVVPNPGHPPQISVYVGGGRLPRQSVVMIHPINDPMIDETLSIGPWTENVWLGRSLDD